jgi:uncharacterized protein
MTSSPGAGSPGDLPARLRAALTGALRRRDRTAVSALRSVLGAIANAEAVAPPERAVSVSAHIAGAVQGLGAAEAARRILTPAELTGLVEAEITERLHAAGGYDQAGRPDRAELLRAEAAALRAATMPPAPTA